MLTPQAIRVFDRRFGLATVAVGVLFALGSLAGTAMNLRLVRTTANVDGIPVKIPAFDGRPAYEVSMLTFTDASSGKDVRVKATRLVADPSVQIAYSASRPEAAKEDSLAALWAPVAWVGGFGLLMVAIGTWMMR